jgi:hypothetical protein
MHERDAAIASMLGERPMAGRTLEVEVRDRADNVPDGRPDITILWQSEVPIAARLGASVLVRRGSDAQMRLALEQAARTEGLFFEAMSEPRLWTLLGVPS